MVDFSKKLWLSVNKNISMARTLKIQSHADALPQMKDYSPKRQF